MVHPEPKRYDPSVAFLLVALLALAAPAGAFLIIDGVQRASPRPRSPGFRPAPIRCS